MTLVTTFDLRRMWVIPGVNLRSKLVSRVILVKDGSCINLIDRGEYVTPGGMISSRIKHVLLAVAQSRRLPGALS